MNLHTGNNDGYFRMNPTTGEVSLQHLVDFDTLAAPTFVLTMQATDAAGHTALVASVATVTVIGVNDEDPGCVPQQYQGSVWEDAAANYVVGTKCIENMIKAKKQ